MHVLAPIRVLATAVAVSALVLGGTGLIPAMVDGGVAASARQPVHQTPGEALRSDLRAIAKANGWTLAQARANHRSTVAVGRLAQAIANRAPGTLVGSALSEDPEGAPTIYLKGPTPAFVHELVAQSSVPILVVDDQPFSSDELEERDIRVQQAFLAFGLLHFSVSSGLTDGGVIQVGLSRTSRFTDAEVAAIVAALPQDLQASVVITVIDPPIDSLLCDPAVPSASPAVAAPSRSAEPCLDLPADWGPLAVVDDPASGGLDAGMGPGRLFIGPRCVTYRGGRGGGVTLVWRAGDTRWDPEARRILFVDRDLGPVWLASGDRLTLGGFSPDTDPATDPEDQGGPPLAPWVQPPHSACPDALWAVHQVSPLDP